MSDEQDSLKDNKISRRQFIKLVGAGTVVAFGIPAVLKNIKEALAITTQGSIVAPTTNATGAIVAPPSNNLDIRPFRVNVPEAELIELRRRVSATRWPERELVADISQGVQLATMQKLAHYWTTEQDWRKVEAKLNALPQFMTVIDGLDIHFIHVRSKHENALPLIVTHGWPGSVIEQLKMIDPYGPCQPYDTR
jgi:hypothetical protein